MLSRYHKSKSHHHLLLRNETATGTQKGGRIAQMDARERRARDTGGVSHRVRLPRTQDLTRKRSHARHATGDPVPQAHTRAGPTRVWVGTRTNQKHSSLPRDALPTARARVALVSAKKETAHSAFETCPTHAWDPMENVRDHAHGHHARAL